MSLVNNMLKDLDQRRKSSDASGAPVDLVPASDPPRSGFSRILIFFTLVLIGIAGGFAYINYKDISLEGFDVSKALDIIPDGISLPIPGQGERADDEPATVLRNQVTVRPIEPRNDSANSGFTNSLAAGTTTTSGLNSSATATATAGLQQPQLNTTAANDLATDGTLPSGEGEITLYPEDAMRDDSNGAPAEEGTGEPQQTAELTEGDTGNGADSADAAATEVATAEPASEPDPSGVINLPPSETFKDYAEMTAEEQDTLAVQFALRLIADNKITEAYTSLEQHIMNNRYAHQSRETYAKLLVNGGELLAARNLVESGLGLAPNHAGFKKIKARILIANGAISEAVELLSSRAPSIHEDLEYHEILATAQLASRDYQGALISYTDLVRQDRTQGKWWYGFAASQESLGNRQAARQGYNLAMQQSNLSPSLRRRVQERLSVLEE